RVALVDNPIAVVVVAVVDFVDRVWNRRRRGARHAIGLTHELTTPIGARVARRGRATIHRIRQARTGGYRWRDTARRRLPGSALADGVVAVIINPVGRLLWTAALVCEGDGLGPKQSVGSVVALHPVGHGQRMGCVGPDL